MPKRDVVGQLSRVPLFSGCSRRDLQTIARVVKDIDHADGTVVAREGEPGVGLFVIVEGQAVIRIEGTERARFGPGEVFGEIGALTGEPPNADVEAATMLRCLQIPMAEVEAFLLEFPRVMFRMLQAEARRLRITTEWKT